MKLRTVKVIASVIWVAGIALAGDAAGGAAVPLGVGLGFAFAGLGCGVLIGIDWPREYPLDKPEKNA